MTCAQYFDYIYKVLIANGAVACAAVLLIKITNSTTYLEIWDGFLPMAGWLLILAEVLLCVSYSLSDYLALRACLFAACVLFVLYGLFGGPGVMLDMVVFNTVMALLNLKVTQMNPNKPLNTFFEYPYFMITMLINPWLYMCSMRWISCTNRDMSSLIPNMSKSTRIVLLVI